MKASCACRDRRYNDSVRMPAGARWSASGNASGVGKGGMPGGGIFLASGPARGSRESYRDELDVLIGSRHCPYPQAVQCWGDANLLELEFKEIGEHYGRYRLHLPEAERAMARSLERYGQLSPVVVCRRQERYELIDGFKRLGAARGLARLSHLWARLMEADERTAKAAMYGLNRTGAARGNWKKPGSSKRWSGKTE